MLGLFSVKLAILGLFFKFLVYFCKITWHHCQDKMYLYEACFSVVTATKSVVLNILDVNK